MDDSTGQATGSHQQPERVGPEPMVPGPAAGPAGEASSHLFWTPPVDLDIASFEPKQPRGRILAVALVVAAVVVAVGLGVVFINKGPGAAAQQNAAANGPAAGGAGGALPTAPGQGQPGDDGQQGFGGGGGGGGLQGEQRLRVTLVSVSGSTVTVKTAAGQTVSLTLDAQTQVAKNGQEVAPSALRAGDVAVIHIYSVGGTTHVERLLVGGGGPGDGGAGAPPTDGGQNV